MLLISLCSLLCAVLLAFGYLFLQHQKQKSRLGLLKEQLKISNDYAIRMQQQHSSLAEEKAELQARMEGYLEKEAQSSTRLLTLKEQFTTLEQVLTEKELSAMRAQEVAIAAEREAALSRQRLEAMEARMQDWEKTRDETLQHTKAAIFEMGSQLSGKLMEEHKREAEQGKKAMQEQIAETTGSLHVQYNSVVENVAALKSQVSDSSASVDIVRRALLSPGGAGSLAEITLENLFKASGLTAGRDYLMQFSVQAEENNRLRPDAVLFLPGEHMAVIDSKASKFFLELGSASGEEEKALLEQLKVTMRGHLKALSTKDYQEAVKTHLQKGAGERTIRHISTFMFLPSETALEKLYQVEPGFFDRAVSQNIIPVGPSGLAHSLSLARFAIAEEQQGKNYALILEEVRKLLVNIATLYDHARKVSSGIQSAANHLDKFAASFNSGILPRAKALYGKGVQVTQAKTLTAPLERFQVINTTSLTLIEGEAESVEGEEENVPRLEVRE